MIDQNVQISDDDEEEDKSIYLKQKTDPRLDKNLTILEFILAFTRYLNIICEVFPQRRRELSAYLTNIMRLFSRFGYLHKKLKPCYKHVTF
jgi:hypothetical protein